MMTGTLRVQSFSARQSAPVPGVFVTLTNADAVAPRPYTFYTDDEGMAEDLSLIHIFLFLCFIVHPPCSSGREA